MLAVGTLGVAKPGIRATRPLSHMNPLQLARSRPDSSLRTAGVVTAAMDASSALAVLTAVFGASATAESPLRLGHLGRFELEPMARAGRRGSWDRHIADQSGNHLDPGARGHAPRPQMSCAWSTPR